MARFEINSISIGFAGLYANLHFTDGSKKEIKADWYNQNFPIVGDFIDIEDGGEVTLVRPWMVEHQEQSK